MSNERTYVFSAWHDRRTQSFEVRVTAWDFETAERTAWLAAEDVIEEIRSGDEAEIDALWLDTIEVEVTE